MIGYKTIKKYLDKGKTVNEAIEIMIVKTCTAVFAVMGIVYLLFVFKIIPADALSIFGIRFVTP